MAILVRYRCHRCGAVREATGGAAWVRCLHCRSLVGFDWPALLESREYKDWLARASQAASAGLRYQQTSAEAAQAIAAGRRAEGEALYRAACEIQLEMTPYVFPPEATTDAGYRERLMRFNAFALVQNMVDPELAGLWGRIQAALSRMDLRDPLPALEEGIELFRAQARRLASLGGPEDPDGLPPEERLRVTLGLFAGAYLHLLRPEQQLPVLQRIHGAGNVQQVGAPSDDLGMYLVWSCPSCGLASFQHRSVGELTCPGCYFRRPFRAPDLRLGPVQATCGGCGALVQLGSDQLEASCGFCKAAVRRAAATGDAVRAQKHALTLERLPDEGCAGFPVTDANRDQLVLDGLGRQAEWYATLVSPEAYAEVVRRTFPSLTDAERAGKLEPLKAAGLAARAQAVLASSPRGR